MESLRNAYSVIESHPYITAATIGGVISFGALFCMVAYGFGRFIDSLSNIDDTECSERVVVGRDDKRHIR